MKKLIKYTIGVDVAKDKLDICLMSVDVELLHKIKSTRKISNSPAGFKDLLGWIEKHCRENVPVQILMEASGVYHEKLAIHLTEKGKTVFVVLPNKAHKYMQSLGQKTKNDKVDAQGLALMCAQQKFDVWQPIGKFYYQLRLLTRYYQGTQQARTVFLNQLHALKHSGYTSKVVSKQLERTIALFEKQIKETRKNITKHINSNEEVKRKVSQVCQIKGVDILTVATLLAETNGFELFKNMAQVVSYAGYDVIENQSGQHTGKTRISKKGNPRIRRILHMPAFNVVRFNETPFVNLYERVFSTTKIKMKAYVAVQKKILVVIYALWKKDQAYQTDYTIQKQTSGNDEPKALFSFFTEESVVKSIKKVVPPKGSTTLDELQYNESPKALFSLLQT